MEIFVGIDVGTTSVKAIAVDRKGKIQKSLYRSLPLYTPKPGWAQQNPQDWWEAVVETLSEFSKSDHRIAAISVSGQMHSLVALNDRDEPVYPSILWCDQRTERQCVELTGKLGGEKAVIESFGNPILTGFTLPKLLWLEENERERFSTIVRWMLPKDYITYRLTGRSTIDYSDASGTSALTLEGEFSTRALELCNIDRSSNPELINSGEIIGPVLEEAIPGLKGVPVVAGGADNASAAFGCGVERPGDTMVSLGTSGTVVAVTKNAVPDTTGGIHLFRHVSSESFYHMAVILSATNSLNWFRERFASETGLGEIETIVSRAPAGSNGIIFLPYLNGERTPHRDPNARGTLFGFSSFHGRGDIFRSIYEGVAFALREGADLIQGLGTSIERVRIVGGGSRSDTWCQIIADNLGKEVWSPQVDEGAAYGSARLAAMAMGIESDSWIKLDRYFVPDRERKEVYDVLFEIYKSLYSSLKENFLVLGELQKRLTK
jgi:xylulokinase